MRLFTESRCTHYKPWLSDSNEPGPLQSPSTMHAEEGLAAKTS